MKIQDGTIFLNKEDIEEVKGNAKAILHSISERYPNPDLKDSVIITRTIETVLDAIIRSAPDMNTKKVIHDYFLKLLKDSRETLKP